MNASGYKKLLEEDAWKAKCMEILQRDNFTCQDCHTRGIHNDTYFSINSIDDIELILPNVTFNGKRLSEFCNSCEWTEQIRTSYNLICKSVDKELFFCSMSNEFASPLFGISYLFLSDRQISEVHFRKSRDYTIQMKYKNTEISGRMYIAFAFEENISKMNYAAIDYHLEKGKFVPTNVLEIFEICIYFKQKLYYFRFSNDVNKIPLFSFKPLHIHHICYIKGKKPWEYNNDNLITLCANCHQNRHLCKPVPLLTDDGLKNHLSLCNRCQGSGFLLQYHYYYGGICFKCFGEGVCGYE